MAAEQILLDQPIYILIRDGAKKIFEKSFTELPIVIGRSLNCEVPLAQYNWISRRHLEVYSEEAQIFVRDLNSANGLTLKGKAYSVLEITNEVTVEIGPLTIHFKRLEAPTNKASLGVDSEKTVRLAPKVKPPVRQNTITQADYEEPSEKPYPELKKSRAPAPPAPKPEPKKVIEPAPAVRPARAVQKVSGPGVSPALPTRAEKPKPKIVSASSHEHEQQHHETEPILKSTSGVATLQLQTLAPQVDRTPPSRRVLETHITWKNQIYDSRLYYPGEKVTIGTHQEDLYAPTLRGSYDVGRFDGTQASILVNKGAKGQFVSGGNRTTSLEDLLQAGTLPRQGKGFLLTLTPLDLCTIDLGNDLNLHVRYAPAPRQLSKSFIRQPDKMIQKAVTYSGVVHLAMILLAFMLVPMREGPKVKGLPPRVAKLLVQKKEPPPKKEEKPPEPPKVVKEEPKPPKKVAEKKPVPPPKKVVVRPNENLKVINKLPPAKVASERVEPPKEKNINELGALAALGALGTPTVANPKNMPVSINVNPNAGGAASMSTSGVIGALKAKGGQLAAGGMAGVKTQGVGYGTGTGYGVQGLKGVAGSRGVAGAVIGSPKLMSIDRNEGLTQKQVMDIVKNYVAKIQQCYERALLSNPSIAGRVEYEWLIDPKGSVKWTKVKQSDISNSDTLNNCVMEIFKNMKFPASTNGEATTPSIGFPFGRL